MAAKPDTSRFSLHPIARLYGQWAFNFMVDIAGAIADDFIDRPQHYREVPDDLSRMLASFRSQLGSHPDWPDARQRKALFRVLGTVCQAGASLRETALIYVETGSDLNQDLLLDTFRDAARNFRSQMSEVEGQSLEIGCRRIDAVFKSAVQLFQSDAIVRAFGLAAAPRTNEWPIARDDTARGTNLATELIRALDGGTVSRALLGGPTREVEGAPKSEPVRISMPHNKFMTLQQAAWYGAQTISGTMAATDQRDKLLRLLGDAYKWAKALQRLIPDVVRVWKDPQYRMRLTDLEWGMVPPHPSGEIDLRVVGLVAGLGASTYTVRGEVCCCTGDLPCPSSSNCEISPGPSCINCGSLAVVQCGVVLPI